VRSLSELASLQSVKPDAGEIIDRGSTTGGPHLNSEDLRRAERKVIHISMHKVKYYQEAGVTGSYLYAIHVFSSVSLLVHGLSIVTNPLHPCRGYVEYT